MRKTIWIAVLMLMSGVCTAEAQIFKKLRKVAERAAERTIEERVDRETSEKTDQALDSVLDPTIGRTDRRVENSDDMEWEEGGYDEEYDEGYDEYNEGGYDNYESGDVDASIEVYSKFDFVPGDKQLFFDDFSNDFIGDFPSKWNTNGSGELVTVGDSDQMWLEMRPGINIFYIPDLPELPEDYTVEFDLMAVGLDRQTSSTAVLKVGVSDNNSFTWGKYATVDLPFCQYHPVGFHVRNGAEINNNIEGDMRDKAMNQPHISIAVNKQRFRLWVDETKYVDIPRMITEGTKPTSLKFELRAFKDGKERLFLSNLKVAEGGVDLRRKLLADGKISTNGILFDSGSANIQPQSMGVIRQIYQVLRQNKSLQLKIVGHTDSEGDEETNFRLSNERAEAVKNVLINIYEIDPSRLQTDGKGESEPVADNGTVEGKAQNRRVEFIRI